MLVGLFARAAQYGVSPAEVEALEVWQAAGMLGVADEEALTSPESLADALLAARAAVVASEADGA